MINAIIIEDEINLRKSLKDLLELFCPNVELTGSAGNVKNGIELIQKTQPQLVFLDIHLPDGSGFDILKLIKDENQGSLPFQVIFTTAFDEFALKAIKIDALDYLLKPIDPDELVEVIRKAQLKIHSQQPLENLYHLMENQDLQGNHQKKKISITTADKVYILGIEDIIRCESQDNYTLFYLREEDPVLVSKTLKEFDQLLQPYDFERIHRSHLINMEYLKSFVKTDGGYVIMKDGHKIPVATRKRDSLLRKIKSF